MRPNVLIKKTVPFVAVLLLAACGGGQDSHSPTQSNSTISINGAVQKGPFIVGTPVFVNRLDEAGNASEATVITEIDDSVGSFSFTVSESGPVQIVSNGYYFSELTGQISSGTLTLKSIYNASNENSQIAYVNILTHLINDRVLELIKLGDINIDSAISQAQNELIAALNKVLPIESTPDFTALSVYDVNRDNSTGNAYLLALSTALYKYAEIKAEGQNTSADAQLSLILNLIAKDFEDDGQIQQTGFTDDLISALRKLNPKAITENLKNRSSIDFSEPLDIPDITVFFGLCAGSANCMWSSGAPMPTPTSGHASAVYNNKIYIFGGSSPDDYNPEYPLEPVSTAFTGVYEYDPESNQWSQKKAMPIGLYDLTAHTVDDKIYIFGGYGDGGFINSVMEYDPTTNNWAQKASMPTYRYTFMSEAVNGKVFIIGGQGTIDDGPWESGKPWEYKSHVEIYDPATDSWSNGTSAPLSLASAASCSINSEIYILGGYTGNHELDTYVYDTDSHTWTARGPASVARNGHSCASIGNDFFVIGGRNHRISSPERLNVMERYSTDVDTWKDEGSIPTARYWFTSNLVGENIYIMGGYGGEGDTSGKLNSVEILDTSMIER